MLSKIRKIKMLVNKQHLGKNRKFLAKIGILVQNRHQTTACDLRSHFCTEIKKGCNFRYDYIIKTEHMDEEANYILRKAGYDLQPWDGFVQRGSTKGGISKSISRDKLKEPLSTISKEDIQKLYSRYELDFEAFGYSVDIDSLNIAGWDD